MIMSASGDWTRTGAETTAAPARLFAPPSQNGPLDNADKARLCMKAREAFEHVHGRQPASQGELNAWRREEQRRAVGQTSLLSATKKEYCAIMAHWWDLLGRPDIAFSLLLRWQTEAGRLAMHKLKAACIERGLKLEYAEKICRCKFKCALADASPKQIWSVFFDVRKRRDTIAAPAGNEPF